jgi:hypothetical protein
VSGSLTRRRWPALVSLPCLLLSASGVFLSAEERLTGREFEQSLRAPISAFREQAELRDQFRRLCDARNIAVWVDRRLDPSTSVSVAAKQVPFRTACDEIAAQAEAEVGVLGSTLLVARHDDLDRVLSLAAAQTAALKESDVLSAARKLALLRPAEFAWNDLLRPRDLVRELAAQWELEVEGIDLVSHDLWAAGEVVDVNAPQALAFVLGQFDLGWNWTASGIEITPLTEIPRTLETYRPRGLTAAEGHDRVTADWPTVEVELDGATLRVRATALEHEAIAVVLGLVEETVPTQVAEPVPLSRRQFSLRIVRRPLGPVLEAMQQQGIDMRYDPAALAAAGVDLDQLISLEFENATADELFRAVCDPVGLTYTIEGATVTLHPPATDP